MRGERLCLEEGVMAQTQSIPSGIEADVLHADDRRFDAMVRGDWAALEASLADDLTYVHSTARLESKAEHVANLRAGKPHYRTIAPRDRRARVHGSVAVVNGTSDMHVENAGKEQRFTIRYLAVYVKAGQAWRMIAWQSTRQPDAWCRDTRATTRRHAMPVLVIGATGFIGPRLIRRLIARGHEVVGMDLNPGAASFSGVPIEAPVVRGDVTHFEDVMRTVLEVKPDRLINLAYGLGAGEGNPHQVMRLDVLGMDNCFEAARLGGVKRVVYASSIAVSGQQRHFGERLVNEDDPTYGTSQYAMHKIFNEFQARKYVRTYGMSITGVRPANVTGPDKVRGSTDHVQLMTDAARGKPVHLPNKGLMRLLIHVDDMAEVFARVLLADAPRHDLYNSGGIPVSLGELADIVRGFLPDAQITFGEEGGREESGNYLVDWSRLAKEFGIEYPGLHTRVFEVINDVRRQEGLPPVSGR
jgi:nucleoside-diphosphate-sugar epimerase